MHIPLPKVNSHIIISETPSFIDLKNFLKQQKKYSKIIILSDTLVYPLYGNLLIDCLKDIPHLDISTIVIDSGESSKNFELVHHCWQKMHNQAIDRESLVIGLGGGVITDLAGFIAACYMRGIDVIHIPTTLMGMIDASIGGKTGINIAAGKNIIGAFHQPKLSFIAPHLLSTLPEKEFVAGLAECVKAAIINNLSLFELLEQKFENILKKDPKILYLIIKESIKIKAAIIEWDEKDKGIRNHLNLGHTFAHALESATNYTCYLHGEAVAIGLICALKLSVYLGMADKMLLERTSSLLKNLKLPVSLPLLPESQILIELMYGDKKTINQKLNLILVKKIGEVQTVYDINPEAILKSLRT